MAQFAITCHDKPGHLELRLSTRPSHVAYLKEVGAALLLAGPLLDGEGKPMGSLLIIEAADRAAAEAFCAADPYGQAGLFETVRIEAFTRTLGLWSPPQP